MDYEVAGFVYSDDVLTEIKFSGLYRRYVQALKDVQKYKIQLDKDVYKTEEHKYFIRKYLILLDRNVEQMREIIEEKYDIHEDIIAQANPDLDFDILTQEQKFAALNALYDKATNKDNAERDNYRTGVRDDMHGRMLNEIQSYNYLENEKYKRCEKLLNIMNENFGFEDPIKVQEKLKESEMIIVGTPENPDASQVTEDDRGSKIRY